MTLPARVRRGFIAGALVAAPLCAVFAPGDGVDDFAAAVAASLRGIRGPVQDAGAAGIVDSLASSGTRNVLLRFEGFTPGDPRTEFVYYRAVFALWPRRALLGMIDQPVNGAVDIARAGHDMPSTAWLRMHAVDRIVYVTATGDVIRFRVDALGQQP